MDSNEYLEGGLPYTGSPLGLGPLWTLGENHPLKRYEDMTETEKEHLIMRCKDEKTVEKKKEAAEKIGQDMDIRALADEAGASGGINTSPRPE